MVRLLRWYIVEQLEVQKGTRRKIKTLPNPSGVTVNISAYFNTLHGFKI